VPLKGKDITEITPAEENILHGDARLIVIAGRYFTLCTETRVLALINFQ
jgi:hypothetical protein